MDTNVSGYHSWFDAHDENGCSYPFELEINNADGTVYFDIWTGNTNTYSATFNAQVVLANPNQWHHLAYVVSASGNTWYIDAIPQTPTYFSGSASSTFFFSNIATSTNT